MNTLQEKLKNCRLIILDFDGVLTDNTVIHSADGSEAVKRSRADSLGVDLLADNGLYDKDNYQNNAKEIDIVILSREANPVVASVAKKIKIKCTQSQYEKLGAFEEEIKNRGLGYEQVIYMGNDLNDLECMKKAGLAVAVADSHPDVLAAAGYVTARAGGHGAFREICELLVGAKKEKVS